jgi:hypothetical protein
MTAQSWRAFPGNLEATACRFTAAGNTLLKADGALGVAC